MSTIRLATAVNVRGFQNLISALGNSKTGYKIDHEALQDEIGRFRVWCGNLGALQKGHSSLDYRLRDSPLLSSNVLKLLAELQGNVEAASEIILGIRLPYEKQQQSDETEDEGDDDLFSENEDEDEDEDEDDEDEAPKTELEMRFREIVDIINNLYKLSVRIRQPTARSRSLKAASYAPIDPETQVDIMEQYATFDLQHTQELVRYLRTPYMSADNTLQDNDDLIDRLARSITLRRRQFKYWKRHREKLGVSTILEDVFTQPKIDLAEGTGRNATFDGPSNLPEPLPMKEAPSQKTGKTLLSATEATHHHQSLDDIVDSKSVTSYATTIRDASGRTIQLPPPPKAADGKNDFECPLCYVMCPARYATQRSWRTHVLQDLQPYVCTYADCETPNQLYQSRRQWAEHEATHRRVWRCPEHTDAVFKSQAGLGDHLQKNHGESIPESQLGSIIKVGQTSTLDMRNCPICYAPVGSADIGNHIANHLERIAVFALPMNSHDETDTGSSQASRGDTANTSSQRLSDMSFGNDLGGAGSDDIKYSTTRGITSLDGTEESALEVAEIRETGADHVLSGERLSKLPNATQDKLEMIFARQLDEPPEAVTPEISNAHGVYHSEVHEKRIGPLPPILEADDIPTLRSLYRSRTLLPQANPPPSSEPNDRYNRMIAFCKYDITRLRVDAIVNSANRSLDFSRASFTLNNYIHNTAGPEMIVACRALPTLNIGQAAITGGFNLPCNHVIHAARPNHIGNVLAGSNDEDVLAQCYSNALQITMDHGLETIAFPSLGSGGCGFPPMLSARIAVQAIYNFLEAHPSYPFKTIIFCVYNRDDEKAYEKYLPIYFPPTQEDLKSVITDKSVISNTDLIDEVEETCLKIETAHKKLANFLQMVLQYRVVLEELMRVAHALRPLKRFIADEKGNDQKESSVILGSKTIEHINLICQLMQDIVGRIIEIIELAEGDAELDQPSYPHIWDSYNHQVFVTQGLDVAKLLHICGNFVYSLGDVVLGNQDELHEINTMSIQLRSWLMNSTGRGSKGVRDHFEATFSKYPRDASISAHSEVVKLDQIPSVSRLYELGKLERIPTYSVRWDRFNDILCLYRGDITQIAVDVMVNSTDPNFEGVGRLDRTLFNKAGVGMQKEISRFGSCSEGDVKLTGGHQLPCKYVLHAVPPETYREDSKDVLRKIYRDILHEASSLKATSIALPAIGTGLLNYPRHNCAAFAIEEVLRFLESTEASSLVKKIVFCVYDFDDELIYKSLLAVYPPLTDTNNKNAPDSGLSSVSFDSLDLPRIPEVDESFEYTHESVQSSMGKALQTSRPDNQDASSKRPLFKHEEIALEQFEMHAKTCLICVYAAKVYREGGNLCEEGYASAQFLVQNLYMETDQRVFSTSPDQTTNTRFQVELPAKFTLCYELLATVEKSLRIEGNDTPFISPDKPWPGLAEYQKDEKEPEPSPESLEPPEKAFAFLFAWSDVMNFWRLLLSDEASIQIYPGTMRAYARKSRAETQKALFSLELTSQVHIEKPSSTKIIIGSVGRVEEWDSSNTGKVLLHLESDEKCEMLFQRLKNAANKGGSDGRQRDVQKDSDLAEEVGSAHLAAADENVENFPSKNEKGKGRAVIEEPTPAQSPRVDDRLPHPVQDDPSADLLAQHEKEGSKKEASGSGTHSSGEGADIPLPSDQVDYTKYFAYMDVTGPEADVHGNTWTKLNRAYISYPAVKEMGFFVAGENAESILVAGRLDPELVDALVQHTAEKRARRSSLSFEPNQDPSPRMPQMPSNHPTEQPRRGLNRSATTDFSDAHISDGVYSGGLNRATTIDFSDAQMDLSAAGEDNESSPETRRMDPGVVYYELE